MEGDSDSGLRVLYVDNHLLVVVKPAGVPMVPDASGDESLLERAKEFVRARFEKPGEAFVGVVHRLDRPVSGVVVLARTSKAAARLGEQFRERTVKKVYWGVVLGRPVEGEGVVEQWLMKDREHNRVRVLAGPAPGALQALTSWKVLGRAGDESGPRTLVELVPKTGRPHQLRVAMAELGCPLWGDVKYGAPFPLPDKSIALHARSLELEHPVGKEGMRWECETPRGEVWRVPGRNG